MDCCAVVANTHRVIYGGNEISLNQINGDNRVNKNRRMLGVSQAGQLPYKKEERFVRKKNSADGLGDILSISKWNSGQCSHRLRRDEQKICVSTERYIKIDGQKMDGSFKKNRTNEHF